MERAFGFLSILLIVKMFSKSELVVILIYAVKVFG